MAAKCPPLYLRRTISGWHNYSCHAHQERVTCNGRVLPLKCRLSFFSSLSDHVVVTDPTNKRLVTSGQPFAQEAGTPTLNLHCPQNCKLFFFPAGFTVIKALGDVIIPRINVSYRVNTGGGSSDLLFKSSTSRSLGKRSIGFDLMWTILS